MTTEYGSIGPGLDSIVRPLIDLCEKHNITIVQIKEKFGGLRFYCDGVTPEIELAIKNAEKLCNKTCENCGRAGELISINGWLRTLCSNCKGRKD